MKKAKINKGIKKNIIKRKKLDDMKSAKEGSALAETVLLVAISLVLIVVLFYPQITSLFNSMMSTLSTWFTNSIGIIGTIV